MPSYLRISNNLKLSTMRLDLRKEMKCSGRWPLSWKRSVTEEECYARVSADRFVLLLRYGGWEELAARTASIGREMEEWAENTKRPYSISMIFGVYIVQDAEKFRDLAGDGLCELCALACRKQRAQRRRFV